MKRKEEWPELLAHYLEAKRDAAFAWGTNDCALFACDAVQLMTGVDLAEELRGYRTDLGAAKALKKFCKGDIAKAAEKMAKLNGIAEIELAYAQRGDVVLMKAAQGPSLAIVAPGGTMVAAPGPDRLTFYPLAWCLRAWRI